MHIYKLFSWKEESLIAFKVPCTCFPFPLPMPFFLYYFLLLGFSFLFINIINNSWPLALKWCVGHSMIFPTLFLSCTHCTFPFYYSLFNMLHPFIFLVLLFLLCFLFLITHLLLLITLVKNIHNEEENYKQSIYM